MMVWFEVQDRTDDACSEVMCMKEVNSYGGHDTSTCNCMHCDINFVK